jgi:hypothetical protein
MIGGLTWFKSDRKKEIERLERQLLELKGRGDYTFDLEKNTELLQLPKGDHLEWLKRSLGYFDSPTGRVRDFYLVFTLSNGEKYLIPRPSLIEKSVDKLGGSIDITYPTIFPLKKCILDSYTVYDGEGNFVGSSLDNLSYPIHLGLGDEINLSYRIKA